jgi:hypothetical protein
VTRTLARALCLVAAVVCGAISLVVTPSPAYACECARRSTTRALGDADAVFRGTVTQRDRVKDGKDVRLDVRFRVDAVYKGTAYADQVVASTVDSASCGLDPQVGSTWVVFATESIQGTGDRAVDRLVTSICSGNLLGRPAPAILGPPRAPIPGASDRQEKAIRVDRRLTRGMVGVGIGVLVLGVAGALVLALGWRSGPPPPAKSGSHT